MSKSGNIFLIALLFLGTALTIFGLANLKHSIGWTHSGRYNFAIFVSLCMAGVVVGSRYTKKPPRLIGTILALGFTLIAGAWWPVIATLWFIFAAFLLGHHIQALLGITAKDDQCVLRFLTGAGVYGTLIAFLAHFPINYPALYGVMLLLPFVINKQVVLEYGTQFKNWLLCNEVKAENQFNWLDALLTVVALIYFVVALMPELGHDALAMHLFIPAYMAHQHQWGFEASTYVWAVMPMLGDWIFSICYLLAGESAVRLINISFVFVLSILIRELVVWGGGNLNSVRWSNLIFFSTPLTFTIGSSLFIESVWTAYAASGSIILFQFFFNQESVKSDILLAALLLGFALATKAITLMLIPALFLLLLWRWKFWLNSAFISSVVAGIGLFLFTGLVPYLTAFYKTGNPIFPFYNHIFKSEFFSIEKFDNSSIFGRGMSLDFPYRVIFHTGEFLESHAGGSGFQWLLLFIPAVGVLLITRNKRLILVCAVAITSLFITFQSTSYIRYAIPECLMFSVLIGCTLFSPMLLEGRYKKTILRLGILTLALNIIFLNAAAFYGDFALKSLLSEAHREKYLSKRMPERNAVLLVNHLNPQNSPVAIFAQPLVAGLTADAMHCSWYNLRFNNLVLAEKDEESLAELFLQEGIKFVIIRSTWGTVEQRELIQKVTDEISAIGEISICQVSDKYRFSKELLHSSDFEQVTAWTLGGDANFNNLEHYVSVNVNSPAFQTIEVTPKRQYKNIVIARSPTQKEIGRMQVNWLDANGKYISTDIRTIECTDSWKTYSMNVFAPANASAAIVYSTGHTEKSIQFKKNSFKE